MNHPNQPEPSALITFKRLCDAAVTMGEMSEGTADYFYRLYLNSDEHRDLASARAESAELREALEKADRLQRAGHETHMRGRKNYAPEFQVLGEVVRAALHRAPKPATDGELAALRRDKERLDWLEREKIYMTRPFYYHDSAGFRAAIDAALHRAPKQAGEKP